MVKDLVGLFMAGKTMEIVGCSSPHRAELVAVREALIFTWEAGFQQIILEGDARNLYTCINSSDEDLSHNGSIIRDIVMYASSSFS